MYAVERMSAWSITDEKFHAFGDMYNAISLRLIQDMRLSAQHIGRDIRNYSGRSPKILNELAIPRLAET
jgi:hypothetical protein